jgi:hypothetical protein
MALENISTEWKNSLKTARPDERVYVGFRKREILELSESDPVWTATGDSPNTPGSHYLSDGHIEYLFPMPDVYSMEIYCDMAFALSGTDHVLWGWFIDSTHYEKLYFVGGGTNKFRLEFMDGGTARYLESATIVSATETVVTWTVDHGNGTGELWIDRTSADDSFSGSLDTLASEFNIARVRKDLSTEGEFSVFYMRFFEGVTISDDDVQNCFKDIKDEEIYFPMNKNGTGWDRCNITSRVRTLAKRERIVNTKGSDVANDVRLRLFSPNGIFADDQYAEFSPADEQYNGTVDQKYLRKRCWVFIDLWYGTDFEPTFHGLLERGGIARISQIKDEQYVSLKATDLIGEGASRRKEEGDHYESKQLVDDVESDSLLHIYIYEMLDRRVRNYLSNSGFENATIGNSWLSSGSCAISRDGTYALRGSYSGKMALTGAGTMYQTVDFENFNDYINKGEDWTAVVFVKSASAAGFDLILSERNSGGENDNTTEACTLAGGEDFKMFSVTHKITDSDSDQLRLTISDDATIDLYVDCALLVYGKKIPEAIALNSNDGTSGVSLARDAMEENFHRIGIEADQVDIEHPWARLEQGDKIWDHIKAMGLACASYYNGIGPAGQYIFTAVLGEDGDPMEEETLTEFRNISSSINNFSPNKIIGNAVRITIDSGAMTWWSAVATGDFDFETGNGEYALAGSYWPSRSDFGEYFAKWGDV